MILRGTADRVLAIDIGGTKLAAGAVSATGEVLARLESPTKSGADAEELWSALESLLTELEVSVGASGDVQWIGVGVGCGGPMDWRAGEVSPINIPGWRSFPLLARLQHRYPNRPVRLHNDAVAMALGEHWRGAGQGYQNLLGMVVSTGVGGGIVSGGRRLDGANGNAGHIGHIVVEDDGPSCGCGGRGCLESIARGPAIAERAGQPTALAAAAAARAGDVLARESFDRAARAIGVALAGVIALLDLEIVVVGGGVSAAWDLLSPALHDAVARHARLDFARNTPVVPAVLGRDAGLVGAAALVLTG